jgi:hypothetical protein
MTAKTIIAGFPGDLFVSDAMRYLALTVEGRMGFAAWGRKVESGTEKLEPEPCPFPRIIWVIHKARTQQSSRA